MGYLHIDNLYKSQDILLFKECYALEKIHGTSAHIAWNNNELRFFSGGATHANFLKLFDQQQLTEKFQALGHSKVVVYGEAYGGKCQGMSHVYGKELKFVVFDVKIGDSWLSVKDMDEVATLLGFEVVDYVKIPTDLDNLNFERDKPSTQAIRNGLGNDKIREGVVLRPLIEVTKNNGDRIIVKHKQESFSERATPQKIVDPATLKILEEAEAIAQEWVVEERLTHILQKVSATEIEHTGLVIKAMVEDVYREARGEIVESREAKRAISNRARKLYHNRIKKVENKMS